MNARPRRTPIPRCTPVQGPRGFTLLEVLVALLVLGIGLLGLAGLQIQGLRFNHDAYVRSQATFLAYDLLERMRLNRDQAAAYVGGDPGGVCGAPGNAIALDDRICWHAAVVQTLPGGAATVAAGANDQYTVTITWLDRAAGNNRTQSWTAVVPPN